MPTPTPSAAEETELADEPPKTDPFASLRHDGFALFLLGAFLSNTGNAMRTTAIGWDVYDRTGQALSLGYIGLVLSLPVLLLALPAGSLADRFSRKLLVVISQLGLAACGFGLAIASYERASLGWMYLLLFGTGMFRALGWPAAVAIVTGLVPAVKFANAATWRSISFQLSATIGPLLAGFLLVKWSPALVYTIDALSSLILIAFLWYVKPAPQMISSEKRTWHSLVEGAKFVRRQPLILSAISLDMVAVLFGGATALLPIYAKDILHVGATGFGWLRAMPSIGAILMALYIATRPPIARAGPALLAAVSVFGIATIVFGLSGSYGLSLVALFILGAADSISVVIRATLVQLLTPDAMRGRVSAINAVFINTSNELGEFESGVAAQFLGTVVAVAGGGIMTLVTVGATLAGWPQLWRLGRLDELEPQPLEMIEET